MKNISKVIWCLALQYFIVLLNVSAQQQNLTTTDKKLINPNACKYCWMLVKPPAAPSAVAITIYVDDVKVPLPGAKPNPIFDVDRATLPASKIFSEVEKFVKDGEQIEKLLPGQTSDCAEFRGDLVPIRITPSDKNKLVDEEFPAKPAPYTAEHRNALRSGLRKTYDVEFKWELNNSACEGCNATDSLKIKVFVTYKIKPPKGGGGKNTGGDPVGGIIEKPGEDDSSTDTPTTDTPPIDLNPGDGDDDCDGLLNSVEATLGTDSNNPDSDNDGLSDYYEVLNGLDPLVIDDLSSDLDNDGLILAREFAYNSSPHGNDNDKDGVPDLDEVLLGSAPDFEDSSATHDLRRTGDTLLESYLNRQSTMDSDMDGLKDYLEVLWQTSLIDEDSDDDGLLDSEELFYDFLPLEHNAQNDYDRDGIWDVIESGFRNAANSGRLSPIDEDSDWDGLPDAWEIEHANSNPSYDPLTNLDGLKYWLRLDNGRYEAGDILRLFNHAFVHTGAIRSDSFARGRFFLAYDPELGSNVVSSYGGNNAFITLPDSKNLFTGQSDSFSLKFNLKNYSCAPQQRLLFKDGVIDIRVHNAKVCIFYTKQDGTTLMHESVKSVPYETWHHISLTTSTSSAVTTEGDMKARTCNLYIDGEIDSTFVVNGGLAYSEWPIMLGSPNSIPIMTPNGHFSDFRFYGKTLSADEVAYLAPKNGVVREQDRDEDGDEVSNYDEFRYGSDPFLVDTDIDGLTDYEEINGAVKSSPYLVHSDSDGLTDFDEVRIHHTNPMAADSDNDRLLESSEIADLFVKSDGTQGHTDPMSYDTDEDGIDDYTEIRYNLNPLIPDPLDLDNDGVNNDIELQQGTDIRYPPGMSEYTDTDGDGLSDYDEIHEYGTDPTKKYSFFDESEGAGLSDYFRAMYDLIPQENSVNSSNLAWNADADGDGVSNADEVKASTDPLSKSNMSTVLLKSQKITEIPAITEKEAKESGTDMEWVNHAVSVYIPDNAQAVILDPRSEDNTWVVVERLELSGIKKNGEKTKSNIGIKDEDEEDEEDDKSINVFRGYSAEYKPGWKHAGKPVREAFTGVPNAGVAGFINSLERSDDGYVTIGVKAIATHPVKADDTPLGEDKKVKYDIVGNIPWNQGWGGFGVSANGSNIAREIIVDKSFNKSKDLENKKAEEERAFPTYGATRLKLNVIATDIDGKSAAKKGTFEKEEKEDKVALYATPASSSEVPQDSNCAKCLIHPTGVQGGKRRISWPNSLLVVSNGQYLQLNSEGFYDFDEALGKVELDVYTNDSSSGGGSISLTGIDGEGNSFGTDSVTFSDIAIDIIYFPDSIVYVPADEEATSTMFMVSALTTDEDTGEQKWESAGDGTTLGVRIKKGENGNWVDNGTITVNDGVASFQLEFDPTVDKDGTKFFVKTYLKQFNAPEDSVLPSFDYGDSAKTAGETLGGNPSQETRLICFSYDYEIFPGSAVTANFTTDPDDATYVADGGQSKMQVTAFPLDNYGNKLREGSSVMWSMSGYGAIDYATSEISSLGETKLGAISQEKVADEFFQTLFLDLPGATEPFTKSVGNMKMTGALTVSNSTVVIGGNSPVTVTAQFLAQGGKSLEGIKVKWYCSNGTFIPHSEALDANGRAYIRVTGNGANVGNAVVYCQAGTASAKIPLTFVAKAGTVSFRLLNPLLGHDGMSTEVMVNGPSGAIVKVGFASDLQGYDKGFVLQHDNFVLSGLNSSGEIILNQDGRNKFTITTRGNLPEDFEYAQTLLTGIATYVNPGTGETQTMQVTPGRVVSVEKRVLSFTLDVVKGFLIGAGDEDGLGAVVGEMGLAIIPGVSIVGDARDIIKEVCRGITAGDKPHDWRICQLAIISFVSEIIPYAGSGISIATESVQQVLRVMRQLATPIAAIGLYANELYQFFQFVSDVIGSHISIWTSEEQFKRLGLWLEDSGIVHFFTYLMDELVADSRVIIDKDGNECYLVSAGQLTKVGKAINKIAKSGDGMLRACKTLKNSSKKALLEFGTRKVVMDFLVDLADEAGDDAAAVARKITTILSSNKFPDSIARAMDEAYDSGKPELITEFLMNMAKVFEGAKISESKMGDILRNNGIFESTLVKSDTSMTLGEMFHNLGVISELADAAPVESVVRKSYQELITGLAKYPTKYLYDDGADNAGSFVRFMAHGRRFEIDFAVAKGPGYQANRNILLTGVGGRYIANSDIDGFMGGVVYSLKRQGKTLDRWVEGKSDEWLEAWFRSAAEAGGGNKIEFVIGGGSELQRTRTRLNEILVKVNEDRVSKISYSISTVEVKPPPAITP